MSATLVPPVAAVARSDPSDRLKDYLEALRFYLTLGNETIDRILFIDNSASDLTPLIELAQAVEHSKEIEFISFQGNDHSHLLGKAYGEFKLMDYGLAHSKLFTADDVIWKTTGRLKFLNLPQMNERCRKRKFDVWCDLHNVPWVGSGRWRNFCNMDLRVFAFRRGAYDLVFRDQWRTLETGFNEEYMYRKMRRTQHDLYVIPRFPIQPKLQGISGRHQRDYRSNSQRTKDAVRATLRMVVPWLWL